MRHLSRLYSAGSVLAIASFPGLMGQRVRFAPDGDAGAAEFAAQLAKTNEQFSALNKEVRGIAENALAEAKANGALSKETKDVADRALAALNKVAEDLKALKTKSENDAKELALKIEARNSGGGHDHRTVGQQFVASDSVKAFLAGNRRGVVSMSAPRNSFRAAITSVTPGGGGLIFPDRSAEMIELTRRRMTVRDLLPQGNTTSNSVEFVRQTTRTNNAAPVTEGGTKPESVYAWEQDDTPVRTLAHITKASRQVMDDAPRLQAIIDSEMRYGLALAEEAQLLLGDGSGQNLDGLIPNATAYSAPISISGAQGIDKLRLAILQVQLNDYAADGIVLHPKDWAAIELLKDGEDRYLWAAPRSGLATPTMWGLPVVSTPAMVDTDFLVGAFQMAARIWDRMEVEVLLSTEDGDNFKQNMITIRAEERLALEVWRPLSLVYGSFN